MTLRYLTADTPAGRNALTAALRPFAAARRVGAVSPEGDLRGEAQEAFGVTTFRGDVARAGAAAEVVTFALDGAERMIVAPATASSPSIATEGRP